MGLPYYQLDADFIATTSKLLAARLKCSRREAIGLVAELIPFVVEHTSTKDKPPDGVFIGPTANDDLEAGAEWTGERGALVAALVSTRIVEQLEMGLRFRGCERYRSTWEKNNRRKPAKNRPVTGKKPAKTGPEMEMERKMEIELLPSEVVVPPPPVPKMPGDKFASGSAFFAFVQVERHGYGLPVEKPPIHLGPWWSEVGMELNGKFELLEGAYGVFARDKYWRDKGFPFRAFMKQWRDFVAVFVEQGKAVA